eukprot:TRINITY_DN7487_c0_g2_i2.p1 TRINITY_DN7487_c0_g2~~TRINITY_DN7487_c0_g2_i2.p1  ORF type:complete len:458 (-),score=87.25 TRINITY_DN7487_c0_g2_i2:106-1479(-)
MFGDSSLYPSLPKIPTLNVLQEQQASDTANIRRRKRKAEKYLEEQYNKKIQLQKGSGDIKNAVKAGNKDDAKQLQTTGKSKKSERMNEDVNVEGNNTRKQKESAESTPKTKKQKLMEKCQTQFKQNGSTESSKKSKKQKLIEKEQSGKTSLEKKQQKQKGREFSDMLIGNVEADGKKEEKRQKVKENKDTPGKKKIKQHRQKEGEISGIPTNKMKVKHNDRETYNRQDANQPKSKFFAKLEKQLMGGRFRWLNEQLYTLNSSDAFELLNENEDYFSQYHEGFRNQTSAWPVQPIDIAIDFVKKRSPHFVVADFGCGDAQLAEAIQNAKVYSIDMVSNNPKVIACDMAKTPLEDACCDIVVFCLALMGINYGDFMSEASRVLKCRGWLWIAEVRSRFDKDKKLKPFVDGIESLGFKLMQQDLSNTHFVVLVFKKKEKLQGKMKLVQWPDLKACQYKKR